MFIGEVLYLKCYSSLSINVLYTILNFIMMWQKIMAIMINYVEVILITNEKITANPTAVRQTY